MSNPTDSQMEYERDGFLSILQDLIAELRYAGSEIWDHYGQFSCIPATPVKAAADRAEARLREVQGE